MTSGLNLRSWHSPSNAHAYRLYVVKELAPRGSRCYQRRPRFCHVFRNRVKRLVFSLSCCLYRLRARHLDLPLGPSSSEPASVVALRLLRQVLNRKSFGQPLQLCQPVSQSDADTRQVVQVRYTAPPSALRLGRTEASPGFRRSPQLGGRRQTGSPGVDPSIVWCLCAGFFA